MLRVELEIAISSHCIVVFESDLLIDYGCANIYDSGSGYLLALTKLFILYRRHKRWISHRYAAKQLGYDYSYRN